MEKRNGWTAPCLLTVPLALLRRRSPEEDTRVGGGHLGIFLCMPATGTNPGGAMKQRILGYQTPPCHKATRHSS